MKPAKEVRERGRRKFKVLLSVLKMSLAETNAGEEETTQVSE